MATGVASWSKTASTNASSDSAVNFAEGQAPSSVNDSARGLMASVAKWRDDISGALTTGGTSTAYTITTNQVFASAAAMDGAMICIIPHTTSGAAPTLAVDGLTARNINMATTVNVTTGALKAGTPYVLTYVNASTEFIIHGVLDKRPLTAIDIANGTTFSDPATGDFIAAYDLSATSNKVITFSDYLLLINNLTADASPDRAADYTVTYDASASAPKKVLLSNLPTNLPRGYIDGCTISNNGGNPNTAIDIAAGVCRDSTNAVDITVSALTNKQLDANWAAGSSAGMRNSAAGIANGTYHIYAVRTAASATADIYAHTSTTAATVLAALQLETGGSSYAYVRRIGSILRESAAIVAFVQNGDYFHRKSTAADISASNPGTSAVTRTLSVPTGIKVGARVYAGATSGGGTGNIAILLSDLDETDEAPVLGSLETAFAPTNNNSMSGLYEIITNTSAQIRSRLSTSGADVALKITTRGWRDLRGKEA